ncbi:hypothetical protein N7490_004545 [Penicillium lividum]|nr:hypothetical protein N7490_004545 [Penicillium lividum]
METQRQQILSEFIQLGVRGREPYRIQKEQTTFSYMDRLPAHSRELLGRVHQPNNGRATLGDIYWLRTSYGQDSEPAWNTIYDTEISRLLEEDSICNDESLYNFGPNWERIFLIKPELLETSLTAEEYEEATQLGLREGIELEADSPQRAENGRDPVDDVDLDLQISFSYHQAISLNRIHIVDARTLASVGSDAGKVLIVFFDEFGRTVRYAREEPFESVEMTALTNAYLDDHACWAWANIGELYRRGQPLGPPYMRILGASRDILLPLKFRNLSKSKARLGLW